MLVFQTVPRKIKEFVVLVNFSRTTMDDLKQQRGRIGETHVNFLFLICFPEFAAYKPSHNKSFLLLNPVNDKQAN